MLVLAKKILESYPKGFFSCLVIGQRGIGKSCYCLICIHDVFVAMGSTDNNGWRLALDCLKFSITDVIDYLQSAIDDDEKKVVLLWDDVRIGGSSAKYRFEMRLVSKLTSMLDAVRTAVSSLVMTAPSSYGLLGILKSYDDYQIEIHYTQRGSYYRVARGYKWRSLPSGAKRIYPRFKDPFNCYIPKWVYDRYMIRRKGALADAISSLKLEVDKD